MKRLAVLLSTFLFCALLSGCSSDAQGDAITNVINQMTSATGDIGNITIEVDKAIAKHERDNSPLDLTEAAKITKKLEETGKNAQKVKIDLVDKVKVIDKDEKDELASRFKGQVNTAFTGLIEASKKLNEALKKAEAIDSQKTEELRARIREAEAPFQALARQT
jgi:hypothetical protein